MAEQPADALNVTEVPPAAVEIEADSTAVGDKGAASGEHATSSTLQDSGSRADRHEHRASGQGSPATAPVKAFTVDELKERALLMFSGGTERPRASGDARTMATVTVWLVIAVVKAIESLMGTPKKPGPHRAEMVRCCGELDKEEARGWLVADAIGRPLLHRNDDRSQNDARDVGKRVLERAASWQADVDSAKEEARSAIRTAKRVAARDPSQQPAVADAESARADTLAKLYDTELDLDIPAATSHRPRPNQYWQSREQAETAAAAEKESHEAARMMVTLDASIAAMATAKLAHESADGRLWTAYARLRESPEELLPDSIEDVEEKAARARDSYGAVCTAGQALGKKAYALLESLIELQAAAHGESDWPPGVLCLSSSDRRELLASWSVGVLAARLDDEESIWDLSDELDETDPLYEWKNSQISRAHQEHIRRLDERLSPAVRAYLQRRREETYARDMEQWARVQAARALADAAAAGPTAANTAAAETAAEAEEPSACAEAPPAKRTKRVTFKDDIQEVRTLVICEDDVRKLADIMSTAEVVAMMANRRQWEKGLPLEDDEWYSDRYWERVEQWRAEMYPDGFCGRLGAAERAAKLAHDQGGTDCDQGEQGGTEAG